MWLLQISPSCYKLNVHDAFTLVRVKPRQHWLSAPSPSQSPKCWCPRRRHLAAVLPGFWFAHPEADLAEERRTDPSPGEAPAADPIPIFVTLTCIKKNKLLSHTSRCVLCRWCFNILCQFLWLFQHFDHLPLFFSLPPLFVSSLPCFFLFPPCSDVCSGHSLSRFPSV